MLIVDSSDKTATAHHVNVESHILKGRRLILTFLVFIIAMLLATLDTIIVSTALPQIASAFNALSQATWVASAYLLTQAVSILILGPALSTVPSKAIYLGSLFVFALGSLICGVAKSFTTLVVGRAIAGWGGGGIIISIVVIISETTRLQDRALLYGLLGAIVIALGSTTGPLIGGALTERLSWRWCFYINLPFSGVIAVVVWAILPYYHPPQSSQYSDQKFLQKCSRLDWIGGILCIGCTVSLLLAMQWGGTERPWNSASIIALFCVSGVLLLIFIAWEWKEGDKAMLPLWLLGRRTQLGCSLASIFIGVCMLHGNFFLPLWYQAEGSSAIQSGVKTLPFLLSIVLSAIISGALIKIIGKYWHVIVIAPMISCVGAGLLSSIQLGTSPSRIIGYQILYGFGIGCTYQNVMVAVQAEWRNSIELMPRATALITFCQIFGGSLGISIAGTVFTNQLRRNLATSAPNLPATVISALEQSATALKELDPSVRETVLPAYMHSIAQTFFIGVLASVLVSLCALTVRSISLAESPENVSESHRELSELNKGTPNLISRSTCQGVSIDDSIP